MDEKAKKDTIRMIPDRLCVLTAYTEDAESGVSGVSAGEHTLFLADILAAGIGSDLHALTMDETSWHYGG